MKRLLRATSARAAIAAIATVALLVAGAVLSGCRSHRSLEELERERGTSERGEGPTLVTTSPPGVDDGYRRVERLFVGEAEPIIEPTRVVLASDETRDVSIELQAGACYHAIAFGARPIEDLDLRVDEPTGRPIAYDDAPDAFPVIDELCPEQTGRYNLRIRAIGPGGDAMYGLYRAPDVPDGSGLAALRRRYASAAHPYGPLITSGFSEAREDHYERVVLEQGSCYAILARGHGELTDLDLILQDEDETILQRDIATDDYPVVPRFCPTTTGAYGLLFRNHEGTGTFSWRLYRYGSPADRPRRPEEGRR